MRNYEAMFIIKMGLEEEALAAVVNKFVQLVQDNGGEVTSVDHWGKRRLAYEINKMREGYYVLLRFKAPTAAAQELERVLKITDEIMRYLITRDEREKAS